MDLYKSVKLDDHKTCIRLLTLEPATGDGADTQIVGTLSTWSLASAPRFTALSYRWGSHEPRKSILINEKLFSVNRNCWHALWQARELGAYFKFWIDAVCINQEDLEEKSAQVAMMWEIFNAGGVWGCVGPHYNDSRLVCDFLDIFHRARRDYRYGENRDAIVMLDELQRLETTELTALLDAFADFDDREYWRRLWIVQELCAASHEDILILCGEHFMRWSSIQLLAHYSSILAPCRTNSAGKWVVTGKRIHSLATAVERSVNGWASFVNILPFLYHWQCQDPRDKIFGIIEIVKWPLGRAPTVDYHRTTTEVAEDTITVLGPPRNQLEMNEINGIFEVLGVEATVQWHSILAEEEEHFELLATDRELTTGRSEA